MQNKNYRNFYQRSHHNNTSFKKNYKSDVLSFTPYTVDRDVHVKYKDISVDSDKIKEPYPICPLCGKKISYISEAFFINGEYVHFDCAKEKATAVLKPMDGEKISYVGKGKFAKIKVLEDKFSFDERTHRTRLDFKFKIEGSFESESESDFNNMIKKVDECKGETNDRNDTRVV